MDLSIVNVNVYQAGYRDFLKCHHIERKKLKNMVPYTACFFLAFRTWILIIFITPHHVQAILVQDWHFVIFCCSNPMRHTSKKNPPYQSSYQIYETSWNHSSNHPCFLKKLGTPKSWDFRETMYVWNAVYTSIYIYTYIYTSIYV